MFKNVQMLGVLAPLIFLCFYGKVNAQATKANQVVHQIEKTTSATDLPWEIDPVVSPAKVATAKRDWIKEHSTTYKQVFNQAKPIKITQAEFQALSPKRQKVLFRDHDLEIITE
ncbi:MAG TPA: hypothetical protein ENJ82_16290 [Bacteroidetes bacterium]|nr:hypothetical protein [Bacteroidota bacterium]